MWFKKQGWLYAPVNMYGWIVIAVAAAFLVSVYSAYSKHSFAFMELVYKIYPHYICTFLLYLWIGSHKSK